MSCRSSLSFTLPSCLSCPTKDQSLFATLGLEQHHPPPRVRGTDAVEALYSVAYALKYDSKNNMDRDFAVGPLEGTWRADDMAAFVARDKNAWSWTMMISQPDWVTQAMFHAAIEKNAAKRSLPALPLLKLVELTEGPAVQIMHIGPYNNEGQVLDRLHNEYLPAHGFIPTTALHEVYLNDPRRTATEKLKTILRQPVASKDR